MKHKAKLLFFCGKMAAGKSTLARKLAEQEDAILFVEDDLLDTLFPDVIIDIPGYVKHSARLNQALTPIVCDLLKRGISVVLDFPGNTPKQRAWFRLLFETAQADHELHYIDASDDLCKLQLKQRSEGFAEGTMWTTDAEFDAVTAYFKPPSAEEQFNVIRHDRN